MKVLLKKQGAKLFLKDDGQWSENQSEANDFKRPLDAMSFCQLHHLEETSIMVIEGGEVHEMPLRCDD